MATCMHGWGSDGMTPSGCPQCAEIGHAQGKEELARLRAWVDEVRHADPSLAARVDAKLRPTPDHSVRDPYFKTGCRCVIIVNDNSAGTYCPVHGDQG